ncbi:MAG: DUF6134 family protein [Pseudomonadota bacterium]
MDRRQFLAGASALACGFAVPQIGQATERAFRKFTVLRDGKDIGTHELSATLNGDRFEIDIMIDLRVRFLGVTAYRYELLNREVWKDGQILSVNSRVNDDGTKEFCKVENSGDELTVSGSRFSGVLPLDGVTTSYYSPAFLERQPWISTQSGDPQKIQIASAGGGVWNVTGDLDTQLIYDDRGEWMGSNFDAGGEPGTYELVSETGQIGALWAKG